MKTNFLFAVMPSTRTARCFKIFEKDCREICERSLARIPHSVQNVSLSHFTSCKSSNPYSLTRSIGFPHRASITSYSGIAGWLFGLTELYMWVTRALSRVKT